MSKPRRRSTAHPDIDLDGKEGALAHMGLFAEDFEETVVEDALPGAGDIHDHHPGSRLGEDVFSLDGEDLRRRHRAVFEEFPVVLMLVHGIGGAHGRLRTAAPSLDRAEVPVVQVLVSGIEGIVGRVHAGRGDTHGAVFVEAGAQYRHLPRLGIVEVDGPAGAAAGRGFPDAGIEGLEDDAVFLELDLGLGGVDVHVDGGRVHLQEDEIGRRRSFRDQRLIGLHDGLVQVGTPEIAAVDEEELVPQGLLRGFGPAHEAVDPDDGGIGLNVRHFPDDGASEKVHHPEFQGFRRFEDMDVPAVVDKGEGDVRPGEGDALELLHDVAELHVVGLEELAAGRDVVKEVADREVGALGGGDFAGGQVLGAGEFHLHAHFVLLPAGPEDHVGDGGDGSEGLPAETESTGRHRPGTCRSRCR